MPAVNKVAIHNKSNQKIRKTYSNSKFILNSRPSKVCNLCNLHKLHADTLLQGNKHYNITKNNKNMPTNKNHGLGKIKSETQTSL